MKALTQLFSAPPADYTKGRVGWGIPSARDDGAARQESPVRIIELSQRSVSGYVGHFATGRPTNSKPDLRCGSWTEELDPEHFLQHLSERTLRRRG
jgi:hypothetical protein